MSTRHRFNFLIRHTTAALASSAALLLARAAQAAAPNAYAQTNLIATDASYDALHTDPTLVNAWGIAIWLAGLGGHF